MRFAVVMLVALSGCGLFKSVKEGVDKVKGVTDPLVARGVLLNAEEPPEPELQALLDAASFEVGTGVQLFLADSVTSADSSPLIGARANLEATETVQFEELGEGLYTVSPEVGPDYVVGDFWSIGIRANKEDSSIGVELPPPAEVAVAEVHSAQGDMILDLAGQGFQAAMIVVIDQTGTVTWTNEPSDLAEAIEFAGKQDLELYTIPGVEAFPTESPYAVGVAGMRTNVVDDVENMNTFLSGLQAGQLRWYLTTTIPL